MTNKRKTKKQLRNGCSRTEVFISPKNYKTLKNKSDLTKDWFVECRFYDPLFKDKYPEGFQFRRRPEKQSTLTDQKRKIQDYKTLMEKYLDLQNFNPITKEFMEDRSGILSPNMDFKSALLEGVKKITASEAHIRQVDYAVRRFVKGLDKLSYSYINISDVKIHHIKNTLENLDLPPYYFNKFRAYLTGIFKELIEYGCIGFNPVRDISKKKFESKPRTIFTDNKLKIVFEYLHENYPDFFRYGKIFFYSGARSAELLRVQRKHVDLQQQEYLVQIQKGKQFKWVTKAISNQALPYWKEIVGLCKDDEDYLFSSKQIPGSTPIQAASISQRWYRLVKKKPIINPVTKEKIVISEDFYSLKHLFLDKLEESQQNDKVQEIGFNVAQIAADHTTSRTTAIYTTGKKKREMEILKKVIVNI